MEGFGSGSAGSKGGSYGGYSSKDVTSGGFGTGSTGGGYDDAKRVSSWRTAGSKHEEVVIDSISICKLHLLENYTYFYNYYNEDKRT